MVDADITVKADAEPSPSPAFHLRRRCTRLWRPSAAPSSSAAACVFSNYYSNVWLIFGVLWEARSRLYRRRFLQVNSRWKALDEIYKIYMLFHRSDPQNYSTILSELLKKYRNIPMLMRHCRIFAVCFGKCRNIMQCAVDIWKFENTWKFQIWWNLEIWNHIRNLEFDLLQIWIASPGRAVAAETGRAIAGGKEEREVAGRRGEGQGRELSWI